MRIQLEIDDEEKGEHLVKFLQTIPYVEVLEVLTDKELLISDIKEAVENLKLIRSGKLEARDVQELLDELADESIDDTNDS